MAFTDRAEQCHAFLARGGVGGEVHVLDHHVDRFSLQQGEALILRQRGEGTDFVQGQRQRQRLAHGGVVVNDQDCSHFSSTHAGIDAAPVTKVAMTIGIFNS